MQLASGDFDVVCQLVHDLCGVYLDESKGYLIETRLSDLVQREGCESYAAFALRAADASQSSLRNEIIDAITTNETLFFRDGSPFEAMQHKAVPELIDARANTAFPKRLRIWSAACSTGQEPYSIAMTLHELIPDIIDWDIRILATDISDECIARASLGVYAPHEIERGLSQSQLTKYFTREGNGWKVSDKLRWMVSFHRQSLLDSFSDLGSHDIIFCRNVVIYFTPEARKQVFMNLRNALAKDGYLFVGSSESLADLGEGFKPYNHCCSVFYRPNLPYHEIPV